VKEIAAKFGCGPLVASILIRRDRISGKDIQFFLEDDRRYLHNAFQLPGMEDAVERILAAKDEGEKVLIYGDRDVDGITSTTLLTSFLQGLGMDVIWRIPTGDEAYGLSKPVIDAFYDEGGTLIITVDCGISNVAEVAHAAALNIDVIITDHHNTQSEAPAALAIVNPKIKNASGDYIYPFPELAGCGVAYKVYSALRFALGSEIYNQNICLFDIYPANDAYVIEIIKTRNLAAVDRLSETVVPGMVKIGDTRLVKFLEGQQIFTWDTDAQKKMVAKIFGAAVEINMLDIAGEIAKEIPPVAGMSLLRLREVSKIARYADGPISEIDVFYNLFVSFVLKREQFYKKEDSAYIQLAAVGTIADLMPLVDENRIIVRQGLGAITEKARSGLSDLLLKLNISGRRITTADISWHLSPVINSAGRMGHPEKAVELLLEPDPLRREQLTREIIEFNNKRKQLVDETWPKAEEDAKNNMARYHNNLAVIYGTDYPRGITGILANNLVKRFNVPSLVVSFSEGVATGSMRSARGYDLTALLDQLQELFIDRGGHDYAAGFSLLAEHWELFLKQLGPVTETMELQAEEDSGIETIDAELPLSYMKPDIFLLVDRFEPYGKENEELNLLCRGMKVVEAEIKGKLANHVKLTLDAGQFKWTAMLWDGAEHIDKTLQINDAVDVLFRLRRNYYKGMETPQMIVSDIQICNKA
jgi:single-stranded-DNA-specific exonuclease